MRQPLKAPKQLLQERELYSSLISHSLRPDIQRARETMVQCEFTKYTFGRKTTLVDRDERRCRLGKYLSKLTRPTGAAKYPMSHPPVIDPSRIVRDGRLTN